MYKNLILSLILLFSVTAFTNILATLKTILMSKKIMNPVYILVFFDAILFTSTLSKVTGSNGISFTLAYALGRTFGVYIGNKIEDKMALGILEVDIFLNDRYKADELAQGLRDLGYSVNNFKVSGNHRETRSQVEVIIKRSEFNVLEDKIEDFGILNPTLKVKTLNKVNGKITVSNKS